MRTLTVLAGLVFVSAPAVTLAQQSAGVQRNQSPDMAPQPPGQVAQPAMDNRPPSFSVPSLTVGEKATYHLASAFGIRGWLGSAVAAAIGQWDDSPHEWGQGARGFGLRYGSSFAGNLSSQTFAWALESAFHQDPRYMPSEDPRKKQRLVSALKQVIICRTDSGASQFAYARVISSLSAGALSSAWQPPSNSSIGRGLKRGVIGLGGDAAFNLLHEFVRFTRPRSLRNQP